MVTRIARAMILEWGMSDRLGFVSYKGEDTAQAFVPDKDYSPDTAQLIDEEIRRLADTAYADAARLVESHWEQITRVAEALLKYETLSREDVERVMRGEPPAKPTVADLLSAEMPKAPKAPPPTPGARPDDGAAPGVLPHPA